MPDFDFRAPRLFVDVPLAPGGVIELNRDQSNYLGNVLRLSAGGTILAFNGRDGEWQTSIAGRKRPDSLTVLRQMRPQDRLGVSAMCSRRSSTRASTTWCKRPSKWAPHACNRC